MVEHPLVVIMWPCLQQMHTIFMLTLGSSIRQTAHLIVGTVSPSAVWYTSSSPLLLQKRPAM